MSEKHRGGCGGKEAPEKSVICSSCGAEYADWAQKCPYCGAVNEKADEKLYLAHMEELRQRLDQVDEEAGRQYHTGIRQAFKKAVIRLAVVTAAVAAAAAGVFFFLKEKNIRTQKEELEWAEQKKEAAAWVQEQSSLLEQLYEAGDYDAILQLGWDSEYGLFPWEHYHFVFHCYYPWRDVDQYKDVRTQDLDSFDKSYLFYRAVNLYWFTEKANLEGYLEEGTMTADEVEKALEYREAARAFFSGRLGLNEEETQQLIKECCEETGYPKAKICDKKSVEYLGK